jgi:PKHD-type hydroxylase
VLLRIPNVLTSAQVVHCRNALRMAKWLDGKNTAGHATRSVKNNWQVSDADPTARGLSTMIAEALNRNELFLGAALPLRVVSPLFNRYSVGEYYGDHVDATVQQPWGTNDRVRTDLSATLFLSSPEDYDGGELIIRDEFENRAVKLPAGDMVLYSSTSVHHVACVTRGVRLAAFFWVQSMVREETRRRLLFELGTTLRQFEKALPEDPALTQLTGVYFNLLRMWTDT